MQSKLSLLEQVVVLINSPEYDVRAGDPGTIVQVYDSPRIAYEVEFVNPDGSARALLALLPTQVRPISPADVFTTRSSAIPA